MVYATGMQARGLRSDACGLTSVAGALILNVAFPLPLPCALALLPQRRGVHAGGPSSAPAQHAAASRLLRLCRPAGVAWPKPCVPNAGQTCPALQTFFGRAAALLGSANQVG